MSDKPEKPAAAKKPANSGRQARKGWLANALQYHVTLRALLSVAIALLLWITLYTTINPLIEKEIYVALNVRGRNSLETKDLYLKNESFPNGVTVTLKGRQEDVEQLTSSNFVATLDLSKINSVEDTPLKIDMEPASIPYVPSYQVTPSEIPVDLEEIVTKQLDIEVNFLGSESLLNQGLSLTDTSWSQRSLTIRDRLSLVSQASHAVAEVDLDGQAGNGRAHPECRIISVEGDVMDVPSWTQPIEVTYEISKEVQVIADVFGTPNNEDYYILSTEVNPQNVYVNGSEDALAAVGSLYTETVDVTGEKIDVNGEQVEVKGERVSLSMRKEIIVPNWLKITSSLSPTQAVVDVIIDRYRFVEIYINKSNINIINSDTSGDYVYEIAQSEISIIVRGKLNDTNDLDPDEVSAVVNADGLRPGTSSRPLIFTLPDGISIVGQKFVDIIMSDANAQVPAEPNGASRVGVADGSEASNGVDGSGEAGATEGAEAAEGAGASGDSD